MGVQVTNNSNIGVSAVTLMLGTSDSDISCITKGTILIPSIPAGGSVNTVTDPSINTPPGAGEFEFIVSPTTSTTDGTNPAKGDFFVTLTSNEAVGVGGKSTFSILLDIDAPTAGLPARVNGPDNIPNNTDDGTIKETFDLDRDHDGLFTLDSRCEVVSEPEPNGAPSYASRSATKKYRTAPLHGVWQHPPYFHNGMAATLDDVIDFYNKRLNLALSAQEKADLGAFLRAL